MNTAKPKEKIRADERLERALFALLAQKPYEQITITELCDTADVARKTFYRKFESMNDLLEKSFSKVFDLITSQIDFVESDAKKIYMLCFEFLAEHKNFTSAFVDPGLHGLISNILKRCVEMAFDRTFYNTVTLEPAKAAFVAPFIAEGLMSIIRTWVVGGYAQSPQALAALAERLLSGVLA